MEIKITYERLTIEMYQPQANVKPDYYRDYAIEQYRRRLLAGGFPDRRNTISRIIKEVKTV